MFTQTPVGDTDAMSDRPFLDLAAQFARLFVLATSVAAFVAVPVLLLIGLL